MIRMVGNLDHDYGAGDAHRHAIQFCQVKSE